MIWRSGRGTALRRLRRSRSASSFTSFLPRPCSYGSRSRPGAVMALTAPQGKDRVAAPAGQSSRRRWWSAGSSTSARGTAASTRSTCVRGGRVVVRGRTTRSTAHRPTPPAPSTSARAAAASTRSTRETGQLRWRARSFSRFAHGREYFYATPTVAYGRVYASEHRRHRLRVRRRDRAPALGLKHAGTYVYTARRGVAAARLRRHVRRALLRARRGDRGRRGAGRRPGSIHGAPTVMDGLVYFATCGTCGQRGSRYAKRGPRATFALDARTGKRVWRSPTATTRPSWPTGSASTWQARRASTRLRPAGAEAASAAGERDPDQRPDQVRRLEDARDEEQHEDRDRERGRALPSSSPGAAARAGRA